MGPFENMPKGFKGRLYGERGKQDDRVTYKSFARNIGDHHHLLRLFFYRHHCQDFDTIKIN